MIPTTHISARDILTLPTLVPEHIDQNPWILYHATTSFLSEAIEREGFVASDDTVLSEAIRKLLTIYHSIGWHGISLDGYPVLGGFSLARNHASAERPLFFTTYAHRSPLYASPDFAGGETAHGIRHAYRDLIRFLNEPTIRGLSLEKQRKECTESVRTGGLPTRVIEPDLVWLRTRLEELEPIYRILNALENSGMPGVIYAVEFTPAEIPHLTYSWTSGVSVFCAVPASRIRHKVEIADPAEIRAECTGDRDMLEDWREKAKDGLLAALEKHGGWKQPEKDPSKLADVRMSLFDPRGGTDHAAYIVEKFGHPHVKAALEGDPSLRQPRF